MHLLSKNKDTNLCNFIDEAVSVQEPFEFCKQLIENLKVKIILKIRNIAYAIEALFEKKLLILNILFEKHKLSVIIVLINC